MVLRCLPAVLVLVCANANFAAEPADLRPGLVATYSEFADGPSGVQITRLEPTVAFTLGEKDTPHPRMKRNALNRWQGHLNIVRAGKYTFTATAEGGDFTLKLNGKDIPLGTEVTLAGGVQPIDAVFVRTNGPARLEVRWVGPGFRPEPLAHQFLGHLPQDRPKEFLADSQREHGRFLFEEAACIKCHKPEKPDAMAKGLAERTGPNLTEFAKRSYAGWLDEWLADPAKLRPHTAMPKMFAADDTGRAERLAIVEYLTSLAGKPLAAERAPTLSNEYRQSMDRGRVLFTVTGCAACHIEPKKKADAGDDEKEPLKPEEYVYSAGTAAPAVKYALGALGSKYRTETLAAYLQNPTKTNPAGRMPHMALNPSEATDLARYLCRVTDETISPEPPKGKGLDPQKLFKQIANGAEVQAFNKLPLDLQWAELGKKLIVSKGCVNCHAVEPGGKPLQAVAKFSSLEAIRKSSEKPCATPVFHHTKTESAALSAFLKDGLAGAGSPSPIHAARTAIRRFNCLNCHAKDGEGGISSELAEQLRSMEKAENADGIHPPLLTGIGHKSRTPWLKSVLTQGGKARPWMQLRMPQYGEANVGHLPESLAFLEGLNVDDTVHKVTLTASNVANGKAIVGKGGLGCISCHDIAGIPNTGTRGPDLATINQRVRFGWYERWLHQPLRMAPGTRMPQAFVDNKSTLATVLNGDPKQQADAMWAYLSLGTGLPLPEGLEPPKGLVIGVKERPEILRTFMPDAGNKSIAVGYPGGVSVAFSADECRLTYAWAGNFLDASPVWNNRGGAPAKLLGPKFWQTAYGHPWGITTNKSIPPDYAGRANNPLFGTPLPLEPARTYDGPRAVEFDGYSLDKYGSPTFRYRLKQNDKGAELKVAETPQPMQSGIATGLSRKFDVEAPAGYQSWFLAGASAKDIRAVKSDGTGGRIVPDKDAAESNAPADGYRVVLPDGDKATVLEVFNAPAGTQWRFVPRPGGGWLAILRLPETKTPLQAAFTLAAWGLPKDDDELLKGLGMK
ncbi:MAG: c-type cytochrome [Gemmataceae bacterium]